MNINEEMDIMCPDGFHVMDDQELYDAYDRETPGVWGIWDKEAHVMITVVYNKANAFVGTIASARDTAKSLEKGMKKAMKAYDYERKEFFTREVAGLTAQCFRYGYTRNDIRYEGDTTVIKHRHTFYMIYFYQRVENPDAHDVLNQVLDSVRFDNNNN